MAEKYLGESIPRLGFGFMRLPRLEDGTFDMDLTKRMVDKFIEGGFTYFDTAYVYQGSEQALKEALIDRYPRDKYQIATKLPMVDPKTAEELPKIFAESMSRLGVDYIDFYLLHSLSGEMNEKAERLGAWEFVSEKKKEGKIRHMGFSFHGKADELDAILTKHPEAEFVQLQINYFDWNSEDVQSRLCYETARKHNVPVTIMEPVKGGMLASENSPICDILRKTSPERSIASWAVRFAASLDGLIVMLSGMNSMEQLEDNMKTVSELTPFSNDEKDAMDEAVKILRSIPRVPCTGCKYCVDNCPQHINVPDLMSVYSDYLVYKTTQNVDFRYMLATREAKASDCVECRSCEEHCPQHIEICKILKEAAGLFDK